MDDQTTADRRARDRERKRRELKAVRAQGYVPASLLLPKETLALLDQIKAELGSPNRSDALGRILDAVAKERPPSLRQQQEMGVPG